MVFIKLFLVCFLSFLIFKPNDGLEAYDCESNQGKYTILSTSTVADCIYPSLKTSAVTNEQVTVLQRVKYQTNLVNLCKVSILQEITHCG